MERWISLTGQVHGLLRGKPRNVYPQRGTVREQLISKTTRSVERRFLTDTQLARVKRI
jgi:hypothetical protein